MVYRDSALKEGLREDTQVLGDRMDDLLDSVTVQGQSNDPEDTHS